MGASPRGFESLALRQEEPNPTFMGRLGFFFNKQQFSCYADIEKDISENMEEKVKLNIKNSIEKLIYKKNIAGLSVAVTDKEKIVFAKNFGVVNTETNTPFQSNSVEYRIASLTKIFTGLTILKLVEDKILNLDTPIINYIPYLNLTNKLTQNTVTLRHLLSHVSGLPKEYNPDGERDEIFLKQTTVEQISKLKLLSTIKEQKYCYSNWGIRLASLVAQEVTGKYFSTLVNNLIIRPLKMDKTTFDPLVALTYPTALPHIYEDGELKVIHKINENATRYAAGGLFSNLEDLSKLARFILNKGKNDDGFQVLSANSINEMSLRKVDCNESYYAYGLTNMFFERHGIKVQGHLGSHPPYATSLIIDNIQGYGIITLMNTYCENLRLDIPFEILKELYSIKKALDVICLTKNN